MNVRVVILFFASLFVGIPTMITAQTPPPAGSSSITVVLETSPENGTMDDLILRLGGSFSGLPFEMPLILPGDLAPNATNTYSFLTPYEFCEIFTFRLEKLAGGTGDDWLGIVRSIQINSVEVWANTAPFSDYSPLNEGNWRAGTWWQTEAYTSRCPLTPLSIEFVTGENGTVDTPSLFVTGAFSASPFNLNLDTAFPANETQTFDVMLPLDFCDLTGWRLLKGATDGVDDDWLIHELHINMDGIDALYTNPSMADLGALTYGSNFSGTWDDAEAYTSRCTNSTAPLLNATLPAVIPAFLVDNLLATLAVPDLPMGNLNMSLLNVSTLMPAPTTAPTTQEPVAVIESPIPLPSATFTSSGQVQVQVIGQATQSNTQVPQNTVPPTQIPATPVQFVPPPTAAPTQVIVVPPTSAPAGGGSTGGGACANVLPRRLIIGNQGRVTPGTPNRVRSEPNTQAQVLGTIPGGEPFTVLQGPTCDSANGIAWWQVDYNGLIGWTAEGQGQTYFVEPA